jgi:hypothetical protein
LSKLLEAWESMPPCLKSFPSVMQAANRRLQHLRMDVFQCCPRLFEFGQIVLLTMVGPERHISRDNVFPIDRTSVHQTLTRTRPVFLLSQRSVINLARGFEPFEHLCRLVKVWINAVSVVHCQHSSILPYIKCCGRTLLDKSFGCFAGIDRTQQPRYSSPSDGSGGEFCEIR